MNHGVSNTSAVATLLAVLGACLAVSPARAHHSHSMFDLTTEETITGTVKAFAFTNPHVYLYVNVVGPDGSVTTHTIEMSHIQNMIRQGITPATLKPGDTVTVRMNPLNTGRAGGSYISLTKDGKEFGRGVLLSHKLSIHHFATNSFAMTWRQSALRSMISSWGRT